ncbi:hypothetical protein BDF20DRAFT_913920 [Mycotypha africana]|uniref:uncharacterized protein n=1 Tax=Mycotypha africana TaxID=64632 RepID=UPI002300D1B4|nr:uncharacterized protein BDF20DRAFT_913920 [Mycotypha africana]KAI8977605.1 hypothetical protein BDF20DRAFT_913920 [Mycotypha africana]
MASKLDQALDDVIRDRRKERSHASSGRGSRRDVRPAQRRGGDSSIRKRLGPGFNSRNNNSSSSGSFGGPNRSFVRTVDIGKRGSNDRSRNVNGQWTHDKFDEGSDSILSRLGSSGPSGDRNNRRSIVELHIENLHYNVTEKDVEELFSTVGEVAKARIKFDQSGRSTGVAFVQYYEMADAEKAVETYNNIELDGQPMRIEIKEREPTLRSNRPRFGGGRFTNSNRYGRGFGGRDNRDGRDHRRSREHRDNRDDRKKQEVTAEDLDKDLESYMQTNNASEPTDMVLD